VRQRSVGAGPASVPAATPTAGDCGECTAWASTFIDADEITL
jgi:bacterioferritin-associated ferredoxin